ncbi:MAG: hypothetical protein GY950_30150 [bacterium]|nr:hypothetical protein [bacterium]
MNLVHNDIYAVGIVLYLLFSRGKYPKCIDLKFITNPSLRTVVRDCLNGTITAVSPIISALNEM